MWLSAKSKTLAHNLRKKDFEEKRVLVTGGSGLLEAAVILCWGKPHSTLGGSTMHGKYLLMHGFVPRIHNQNR
jgi:hypothetical protein